MNEPFGPHNYTPLFRESKSLLVGYYYNLYERLANNISPAHSLTNPIIPPLSGFRCHISCPSGKFPSHLHMKANSSDLPSPPPPSTAVSFCTDRKTKFTEPYFCNFFFYLRFNVAKFLIATRASLRTPPRFYIARAPTPCT